jgi:cell division protein FtsB
MPSRKIKDGGSKVVLIMPQGANHANGLIKIDEYAINDKRRNDRLKTQLQDLKMSLKELRKENRTVKLENKILVNENKRMIEELVKYELSTY